jgi:hypothetical protein
MGDEYNEHYEETKEKVTKYLEGDKEYVFHPSESPVSGASLDYSDSIGELEEKFLGP